MKSEATRLKLKKAAEKDPQILCPRDKVEETLGSDPKYLENELGLTKSDMIRLERLGLAIRARYATSNKRKPDVTGPHRVRWVIFLEGGS